MIRFCLASSLIALSLGGCHEQEVLASEPVAIPTTPPDGYVGPWAATEALCSGGVWRFTPKRLTTAGGVDCEIVSATQGVASWAVSVSCRTEEGSEPGLLTLILPDPARPDVMSVEGGPFHGPVTLTRCNT
jgi:hypothetical protein